MKIKRSSLLLMLILLFCTMFATASFFHTGSEGIPQSGNSEGQAHTIKSSVDVVSAKQPLNPLDLFPTISRAAETDSGTEVTVYNSNLALVKERRGLDLKSGVNEVKYTDVAAFIDPTSVMFEDTKNKDTAVLEQNYEYDLVSNQKLMEKFLDKEVTVTGREGDEQGNTYTGTLLSSDGGVVLRLSDGKVVTLSEVTKVEFPNSADLLTKPTLVWQIYSPVAGTRDVLTSYLTGGMSWKADYIVKTSADDKNADIQGWVSIDNQAGTTFKDAKLKLVAGEVHRVETPRPDYVSDAVKETAAPEAASKQNFAEESLFEYHLYTLDRPATSKRQPGKTALLALSKLSPRQKGTDL